MVFMKNLCEEVYMLFVILVMIVVIFLVFCFIIVFGNILICIVIIKDFYCELCFLFNYFVF